MSLRHTPVGISAKVANLCRVVLSTFVCLTAYPAAAAELVEEIVIVETLGDRLGATGSAGLVDAEELAEIRPTHIHEVLVRIPGVWVSRGSGHEHLTAIRSAVLTGAGACGAFLFLEDGLPIRPAGFCNINNLFEVNAEQAAGIEVWRGPASAALGGNALHGAINVATPDPAESSVGIEGGSYGYAQLRGTLVAARGNHRIALSANGSHSNGYRDDTGYGQQKLSFIHVADMGAWQVRNTLNATNLNQETGGFVRGYKAYDDGDSIPGDGLHMGVAEAEFAFRLGHDLPATGVPWSRDDVMERVAALHVAIEIPDSRFADFAIVGAPQLAADSACAEYFVLGPAAPAAWRSIDLASHPVAFRVNGAETSVGTGANVLGDPRIALTWIANDRAARGEPLLAGEVVTTGTCVIPAAVGPGDELLADFGALGSVGARLVS